MVSVTQERELGRWLKANSIKECNQLKKNIEVNKRNNDDLKRQVEDLERRLVETISIPVGDLIGMKIKSKPKKSIKKKKSKKTKSKSRFKRR